MSRVPAVVAVVSLVGVLAACADDGPAGDSASGTLQSPRAIEISMVDIAFEPSSLTVQAGETVRFVFVNDGVVEHEATFGDEAEQEEHAAEMREAEGMDMEDMDDSDADHADDSDADHADDADDADDSDADHADDDGHGDEPAPLVLAPGESGEVTMTFDDPGMTSTIIGCHVPGHWEAGMRLDVNVTSA